MTILKLYILYSFLNKYKRLITYVQKKTMAFEHASNSVFWYWNVQLPLLKNLLYLLTK